jgi:hypothetical protein
VGDQRDGGPDADADTRRHADAHGRSGDADAHGRSADADTHPGNADACPGDADTHPGNADACPGDADTWPGNTDTCPGHADTCPSHADTCPGNADTCPGNADTSSAEADTDTGGDAGAHTTAVARGNGRDVYRTQGAFRSPAKPRCLAGESAEAAGQGEGDARRMFIPCKWADHVRRAARLRERSERDRGCRHSGGGSPGPPRAEVREGPGPLGRGLVVYPAPAYRASSVLAAQCMTTAAGSARGSCCGVARGTARRSRASCPGCCTRAWRRKSLGANPAQRLGATALSEMGRVDVLINNAELSWMIRTRTAFW